MQYPLLSEYRESILNAEDNFDKLSYLRPVLDANGEPVMSSGNFAVVFKMTDGKKDYAVKCFTKEQEGRADAYQLIAEELESVNSLYITSIKYLEKELFVDCSCADNEFPVLLMDWIAGESMERYIADNYQDSYAMSMLCYRFCKMAAWLRSQQFAHGDLKPDNIIIRPNGELTLVDYDGMFVPAMKGQKSPTVGTKNFSHPLRTVDDFDETIDDLALASIALALKAISLKPSLYSEYCVADRLLFSSEDYLDMGKSKVLTELQSLLTDNEVAKLLSLFLLAISSKDLSKSSFRLFNVAKPKEVLVISTKVTKEELDNAIVDEYGVKYSKDGKKLLKAPYLKGAYIIEKGTQVVSDEAFSYLGSLTSIEIPDSVIKIGDSAFSECSSLTSIEIPNGVTRIGRGSFMDCSSLNSIKIPDSVISIGNLAFSWCKSLFSIEIPDSVISIGNGAFANCSSLKSIDIPDSVISIGYGAFVNCSSLKSIDIPDSVTTMEGNPFACWQGSLKIHSPNFCFENDLLIDKKCNVLIACHSNSAVCSIPDGVVCIGRGAFGCCSSLRSIDIPDSVTSIENEAFCICSSLETIEIPNSVTKIGNSAFSRCSSLKSIKIPDSVISIGDNVFSECQSLKSIEIPNSITSIGERAFIFCKSLKSIEIPDSVTSIGDYAFRGCDSISSEKKKEILERFGNNVF